jgi:site-specific recombinase XerD
MSTMELEKQLNQFVLEYQVRLKPKTLEKYQVSIKRFFDYSRKALDIITKNDIRNWIEYLIESGYKSSSINEKLSGIKLFFKYCWEEEIISLNPVKDVPYLKVDEKLPCYLSKEQLNLLRGISEGLEERAIIEVLYATGVRLGELAEMTKEDINWSERLIVIPNGKGRKGRIVLFNSECTEHLKAYLDSRTDNCPFVFALVNSNGRRSKYARLVNSKFLNYSKQLGFKVTPHMLRHTFAAHLAKKGMPLECIQVLLGHDKFETTQVYARLYDHARKEMYNEFM